MIDVLSTAMVLQTSEAPNIAAGGLKTAQSGTATKSSKTTIGWIQEDFRKRLKSCETMTLPQLEPLQLIACDDSGGNETDNSMAGDSDIQGTGIVGILEGFGLLDYQSDNVSGLSAGLPVLAQTVSEESAASACGEMPTVLIQKTVSNEDQENQLPEQFARMLTNGQLDALPESAQQEILSAVGEYLCSFESTNNTTVAKELKETMTNGETTTGMEPLDCLLQKVKAVLEKNSGEPQTSGTKGVSCSGVLTGKKENFSVVAIKAETGGVAAVKPENDNAAAVKPENDNAATVKAETGGIDAKAENTGAAVNKNSEGAAGKAKSEIAFGSSSDTVENAPVHMTAEVLDSRSETEETPGTAKDTQNAFAEENVIRIVDKVSTQAKEGRYDFDMELKPDFLGKVNIRLTMEDGNLKMRIRTEDMAVKELFSNEIPALQTMLKEKGFTVSDINVAYESQAFSNNEAFEQNGDSGTGKQSYPNELSYDQTAESVLYDAVMDLPGLYAGTSSVEYLA
ncbi:MAG: flagellar hook-length control protein FliK [Eubacteriales bacterium]|nr:flagellar hook-length control protein FliK [Eubacteriales bacterium]